MDMDFDKGWSRLEKVLLFCGKSLAAIVGFFTLLDEGIGVAALAVVLCMTPWLVSKIIKWIIDRFRG